MELTDVKIDTFWIGTENAVRATHIPTGIVEIWSQGLDFLANRETVLKRLTARVDARTPYVGDPGDETSFDNWGSDGGR